MEQFGRIIDRITDSAYSDGVTFFFGCLIASALGLAILTRMLISFARSHGSRFHGFDNYGPTLLTTLGVFGTFTGILIGLLDFDVNNIDDSVPQLLGGLKIAFITSILGMAAAIILRIVQVLAPQPDPEEAEVTPGTIHTALEGIKKGIEDASEQEKEALDNLRKSVSADGDSSLLTQLQKLRTDFKDTQNELIKEFRQFAETMAENNSNALIEALEKVIRDFNTQLNEQFGENFKQLNQAVSALLTWQESYRQHVETLEARFSAAVQGIEASEQAIREIAAHTATIPPTLEKLEAIVQGIGDATIDLNGHLSAVSGLKGQALQAFPTIEQNLKQITDDLSDALQRQRDANDRIHQDFDTLLNNSREAQTHFDHAVSSALQSMQASLHTAMDKHTRTIEITANEMQNQINQAWKQTSETIENRLENLDRQMQQELIRSIEILGRNLAALSEKFVQDYSPLTDRLREVVQSVGGRV